MKEKDIRKRERKKAYQIGFIFVIYHCFSESFCGFFIIKRYILAETNHRAYVCV